MSEIKNTVNNVSAKPTMLELAKQVESTISINGADGANEILERMFEAYLYEAENVGEPTLTPLTAYHFKSELQKLFRMAKAIFEKS